MLSLLSILLVMEVYFFKLLILHSAHSQSLALFSWGYNISYFMNHTFPFVIQHPLFNMNIK